MDAKGDIANDSPAKEADSRPSAGSNSTAADVMQVLAEFEMGLTSLKSLYSDRQQIQERLTVQQAELEAQQAALAKRQAELDTLKEQLAAVHAKNEERSETLEASALRFENEFQKRRSELEAQAATLDAERQSHESQRGELESLKRELEKQAAELDDRLNLIEREQQEFEGRHQTTERELAAKTSHAEELLNQLDTERAQLDERQAELAAQQKRLDEAAAAHAEATAAAERSQADQSSAVDQLQQELAAESDSLRQAKADFDAKMSALDVREAAMRCADASTEKLLSEVERAQARAAQLEQDREGLRSRTNEVFAEYEALLAVERSECVRASAAEASLASDVERLAGAIEKLKNLLNDSREQAASLRDAGPAPSRHELPTDGSMPAWWGGRRSRLKKYRDLVQSNALKVRKASEGLSKRFEQCEHVLSQRAELALIRERVLEADRRIQRHKAGSRAIVAVFCGVVGLSLLGGLSWALAREVAPSRFVAESVLVAEGRGRELNEAERAEWQRFHVAVLADPMFHEATAERFRRQGSTELASPAAISELVTNTVTTESLEDGELRVRMVGLGADHTARTLDTFSASMASFANASQQRRIDGGATKIRQAAKAGDTPVDHSRTVYALVMLGLSAIVSLGATFGVWRKLSRAKTAFEQDEHIAMTLDEARWVEPPSRR